MGRNHLAETHGNAGNAVLAASYNLRLLLEWLPLLLSIIRLRPFFMNDDFAKSVCDRAFRHARQAGPLKSRSA
jgi:hypothetical protein